MQCDRPFRPSAARRSRAQRTAARADRRLLEPARAGRRRPHRRRVHLRRGRARVARGAGADPQIRRDGDGRRRRGQRGEQRRGARRPRASGRARRPRRRRPAAARELSPRRRSRPRRARAATARRSRRASSRAASIRPSSRSCASIAKRAGRWPTRSAARSARRSRRRSTDCDAVLLSDYGSGLVTPALADGSATRSRARARRRPVPGARRFALPAARLPRPDGLHAERVGGRAGARHPHRRRREALERAGRTLLRAHADAGACSSRAAAAAWRCSSPKQPTVHIPIFGSDEVADVTGAGDTVIATFGARRWRRARRSTRRRGWPTTPAAWS